MNKKLYVLLLVIDNMPVTPVERFLLVLKDRPEWMKGFFNLVGGKVEENESPYDAAVRELEEETGLHPVGDLKSVALSGAIEGDEEVIFCYRIYVNEWEIKPRPGETEKVRWVDWDTIKDDSRLMPNLRVVIPLMLSGLVNWRWINNDECVNKKFNSGYLTFPGSANPMFSFDERVTKIFDQQGE